MFLDLRRYRAALREHRQTPFTPPVPAVVALEAALEELEEAGGVSARRLEYQARSARLRAGLKGLGFRMRFDGPGSASSLTIVQLPSGFTFDRFSQAVRARGFLIYRGKGPISHDCFLLANMGHIDLGTIDRFLEALADITGQPEH